MYIRIYMMMMTQEMNVFTFHHVHRGLLQLEDDIGCRDVVGPPVQAHGVFCALALWWSTPARRFAGYSPHYILVHACTTGTYIHFICAHLCPCRCTSCCPGNNGCNLALGTTGYPRFARSCGKVMAQLGRPSQLEKPIHK